MYRNKPDIYHIPIRFYNKYSILLIASVTYFNLCIITFICFLFFYKSSTQIVNNNEMLGILLLTSPLYLYVLYLDTDLIHSIILKRQYVEIDYDGIKIKKLFNEIVLGWNELFGVEAY
jgi:hypothetical protein